MNNKDFAELVGVVIDKISSMTLSKGTEYAGQDLDRLSAFKRAGIAKGKIPEEVLQGYVLKHDTSIDDMVKEVAAGLPVRPWLVWEEKIMDRIIYNILLLALVSDRNK